MNDRLDSKTPTQPRDQTSSTDSGFIPQAKIVAARCDSGWSTTSVVHRDSLLPERRSAHSISGQNCRGRAREGGRVRFGLWSCFLWGNSYLDFYYLKIASSFTLYTHEGL